MERQLKTILYAEDEDDIRSIAQIALEDIAGFTVKYCKDGQEVLNAVKDLTPDLLLFDVMMPKMDGPTTLREIRKIASCSTIPAIFMTAKIQTYELEEYKTLGAIDVISKPFDPITLGETIKKIWSRHYE